MKISINTLSLLGISIIIDIVQVNLLFQEVLCGIPSLTGIGTTATIICWLGAQGINSLATIIWFISAKLLLRRPLIKIDDVSKVALFEFIPVVSTIPTFTFMTLYNIWKMR